MITSWTSPPNMPNYKGPHIVKARGETKVGERHYRNVEITPTAVEWFENTGFQYTYGSDSESLYFYMYDYSEAKLFAMAFDLEVVSGD